MAKHCFNNKELAHAFFHQDEFGISDGYGSNFKFQDNKIYSYSSVIGIADFENKILLFRSGSYSSSTSKHQLHVSRAVPNDWSVFYWNNWHNFPDKRSYLDEYVETLAANKNSLNNGISYFGNPKHFQSVINSATSFCSTMQCEELLPEYLEKYEKYRWIEEDNLKFEVKNWAANNKFKGSYEKKLKYFTDSTLKTLVEEKYQQDVESLRLARFKAQELKAQKEKELIDKWLAFEYNGCLYNVPIYLRLKQNTVETSRGVLVPLSHCELLYKKFRECVDTDTEWESSGCPINIGNYKVQRIYKKLNLQTQRVYYYILAGCHDIRDIEIEKFVKDNNLNW